MASRPAHSSPLPLNNIAQFILLKAISIYSNLTYIEHVFYDLVISEFLNCDIYKFAIEFFILTLGDWVAEVNASIHINSFISSFDSIIRVYNTSGTSSLNLFFCHNFKLFPFLKYFTKRLVLNSSL